VRKGRRKGNENFTTAEVSYYCREWRLREKVTRWEEEMDRREREGWKRRRFEVVDKVRG
jgi:hypothetical protein